MLELLKMLYEFLVIGVGLALIRGFIADKIREKLKSSDRRNAIWKHYNGSGHTGEVEDCTVGECNVLRTAQSAPAVQSTSQLA